MFRDVIDFLYECPDSGRYADALIGYTAPPPDICPSVPKPIPNSIHPNPKPYIPNLGSRCLAGKCSVTDL